jgi:hypothetical protein
LPSSTSTRKPSARACSQRRRAVPRNLYDELKRKHAAVKFEIDDETIEELAKTLHRHLGDDLPEAMLAPYPRWFLTHLCVMLAAKLGEARKSVEVLLQQREAAGADLAGDAPPPPPQAERFDFVSDERPGE